MALLRDVISKTVERFSEESIDDAVTDAWLLLEYVSGITKQQYYMDMNMQLPDDMLCKYEEAVEKRLKHIPLQHITGCQEFMGLNFIVNEHVLIPRQDTELLVEKAMEVVGRFRQREEYKDKTIKILDMCTGSGCIAISMAKLCEGVEVDAVDISEKALEVAKRNAVQNGVDVKFINSDLFESVSGKYHLVLSNPPYIPTKVIETLEVEVKDFEPMNALDGDADGLKFYEKISEVVFGYIEKDGVLIYEIGHDQGELVSSILRKKTSCVKVYKDLAGLDRVVVAGKEEL